MKKDEKPEKCKGCPLYETGIGPVNDYYPSLEKEPSILVIGEAPGAREVRENAPFVGPSGRLLRRMFYQAGLKLSACVVTNTIRCRLPGNDSSDRKLMKKTIDHCTKQFLSATLEKNRDLNWLVCGTHASQYIVGEKITSCMGYVYKKKDIGREGDGIVVPCLHPAAILHDPTNVFDVTVDHIKKIASNVSPYGIDDYIIDSPDEMQVGEFLTGMKKGKMAVVDIETLGVHSLVMTVIGITRKDGQTISVPWTQTMRRIITPYLEDPDLTFIAHNAAFDGVGLLYNGVNVFPCTWEDTMYLARLCGEEKLKLEALAARHLNVPSWKKKSDVEGMMTYNAKDVHYTWKLYNKLKVKLYKASDKLYEDTKEIPKIAAEIQRRGMLVDIVRLKELRTSLTKTKEELMKTWSGYFPSVSPTSPKQLLSLFEEFNIDIPKSNVGGGKWKKSTNERALTLVAAKGGMGQLIAETVLKLRKINKVLSTYTDYPLDDNNVLHPNLKPTGTVTGRWSSSDPNMQNIPIRDDEFEIRKIFIARPGMTIIEADYSQAETRVTAILAKEEKMLKAWEDGRDIHTFVASNVYGVPYDKVGKSQRNTSKNIGYAMAYGSKARGISNRFGLDYKEVKRFLADFAKTFPNYFTQLNLWSEVAQRTGMLVNIFGRVHHFHGDRVATQAMNFIPQSTVADMINYSLLAVYRYIKLNAKDWHIILQIHDSILLEVPDEEVEEAEKVLIKLMGRRWPELGAHLIPVEVAHAKDWYSIKG